MLSAVVRNKKIHLINSFPRKTRTNCDSITAQNAHTHTTIVLNFYISRLVVCQFFVVEKQLNLTM